MLCSYMNKIRKNNMSNIEIFKDSRFGEVRVAGTSEKPLFCLADVCKALDLQNPSQVKARLDEEDVQLIDLQALNPNEVIIGNSIANFVTESGLYDVLMRSESGKAKPFRRWVTKEVLPSIRKDGMYATEDTIDKILNDPDYGIRLLTKLKEERAARIEAEKKNAILMHVNKTYTATEIAKELNMKSAQQLNTKLEEMGVQYKVNNTWVLYSQYSNLGYEEIKQEVLDSGKVVYHRKFTQMGRDFIVNLISGNKEA